MKTHQDLSRRNAGEPPVEFPGDPSQSADAPAESGVTETGEQKDLIPQEYAKRKGKK